MMNSLSPNERRRVAVEALAADRSVVRAYREPERVRESTWLRIRAAAHKLGLPEPPEPHARPG